MIPENVFGRGVCVCVGITCVTSCGESYLCKLEYREEERKYRLECTFFEKKNPCASGEQLCS